MISYTDLIAKYKNPNNQISDPTFQGNASPANTQPAANSSLGNASDPTYGSFSQPFDINSFYQNIDPSYLFRLQQGQQGLANSAAAGSGALSGSALKDLIGYNQESASQEYGNAFNRYQTSQGNIFNRLMSIAGLGQSGAANVGANNSNLIANAGQAVQNAGTATGAGYVGASNSLSGGLNTYMGAKYYGIVK